MYIYIDIYIYIHMYMWMAHASILALQQVVSFFFFITIEPRVD